MKILDKLLRNKEIEEECEALQDEVSNIQESRDKKQKLFKAYAHDAKNGGRSMEDLESRIKQLRRPQNA